ncbi:MAG: BTAD domain-containing putative transcriptional regulator [Acidimicrobiales bacterium]
MYVDMYKLLQRRWLICCLGDLVRGTVGSRRGDPVGGSGSLYGWIERRVAMADLLFGRPSQLEMVIRILTCSRLVTITGSMGIGKSFFVRQLCSRLGYPPASVASVGFPAGTMAEGFGSGIFYNRLDELVELLGAGNGVASGPSGSLLVLDGCDAALEKSSNLAGQILLQCPDTRVVATSQIPLHIPGEVCFELPPLSLPLPSSTPEELLESEAGSLFVTWTKEVSPHMAIDQRNASVIADICIALRGIPLPMKMAATLTSTLTPENIATRLSEGMPTSPGWGSDRLEPTYLATDYAHWTRLVDVLLNDDHRTLLAAVGVFPGGATSDAIAAVIAGKSHSDIARDLGYLASLSMVNMSRRPGHCRYFLADPLRAYFDCAPGDTPPVGRDGLRGPANRDAGLAAPQASPRGVVVVDHGPGHGPPPPPCAARLDDRLPDPTSLSAGPLNVLNDLRNNFVKWCIDYTRDAEEGLVSSDTQKDWLERLDSEQSNLREAIRHAIAESDSLRASMLAAELWRYWEIRNKLETGRTLLEQIVALDGFSGLDTLLSLRIYDGLGMISWRQGDYRHSEQFLRIAVQKVSSTGDGAERYLTRLYNHLGLALAFAEKSEEALELFQMAVTVGDQQGNYAEKALALANIGLIHAEEGRTGEARKVLVDALGTEGTGGDIHGVAISWLHLGIVDLLEERYDDARQRFYHATRELIELRDERSASFSIMGYAVSCVNDYPRHALLLAGAANAMSRRLGAPAPRYWRRKIADALSPAFVKLGDTALTSWTEGQSMSLSAVVSLIDSFHDDATGQYISHISLNTSHAHAGSRTIRLQLFGGFCMNDNDGEVDIRGKSRTAIAVIGAFGGTVHVEQLLEALWPDTDPEISRRRLRNVLMRLKGCVGPVVARHDNELKLHPSVECDILRFTQLARQCMADVARGAPRDIIAAIQAVRLYRGDLLPEFVYDEWASSPRERAKRLYIRLLNLLATEACEQGSPAATGWLEALIAADPYDEESYVRLARFQQGEGRILAALDTIERARSLAGNLGVAPSAMLLELDAQLHAHA